MVDSATMDSIALTVGTLPRNPSREAVSRQIRNEARPFYVYVLRRPDGEPFYVGKGQLDRVFCHERDALYTTVRTHKLNVIRVLHGAGGAVGYGIDSFFDREADALARERALIQSLGRHNLRTGPLTNLTDGGEGLANFSEETRQRHRDTLAGVLDDGSARSSVNAFFLRLGIAVASVPIKPLSQHRPEPLVPHAQARQPKPRQAAALAAAAIGNGVLLAAGVKLHRRFRLDDLEAIIENGVGKDILKSGMAVLHDATPKHEVLEVTLLGYEATLAMVGRDTLIDLGALMPKA